MVEMFQGMARNKTNFLQEEIEQISRGMDRNKDIVNLSLSIKTLWIHLEFIVANPDEAINEKKKCEIEKEMRNKKYVTICIIS